MISAVFWIVIFRRFADIFQVIQTSHYKIHFTDEKALAVFLITVRAFYSLTYTLLFFVKAIRLYGFRFLSTYYTIFIFVSWHYTIYYTIFLKNYTTLR